MTRRRSAGQVERERREAERDIAKTDERLCALKEKLASEPLSPRELTKIRKKLAVLEQHLITRKKRLAHFEKKVQFGE